MGWVGPPMGWVGTPQDFELCLTILHNQNQEGNEFLISSKLQKIVASDLIRFYNYGSACHYFEDRYLKHMVFKCANSEYSKFIFTHYQLHINISMLFKHNLVCETLLKIIFLKLEKQYFSIRGFLFTRENAVIECEQKSEYGNSAFPMKE